VHEIFKQNLDTALSRIPALQFRKQAESAQTRYKKNVDAHTSSFAIIKQLLMVCEQNEKLFL